MYRVPRTKLYKSWYSKPKDHFNTITEGIASKLLYSNEAKEAGIEGKIYVQAFINESGDVTKVKLIKGLGFGLDQNALAAIYNTKFTPGKIKGKPTKIFITIPVQFTLE